MTVLSQFFGGSTGASGAVGGGNIFLFGTTGSVTLPSTTKYVAYATMGAGGGSVRNSCCVAGSSNIVCTCGSAGGGFSANWGDHAPGTTTTVCVTVGAGPGGTSCVTGLLPGNISATGGGNGSACSYARGVGSGGKINTCGGFGGCATAIGCDSGGGQWSSSWVLMTGAGAGGMYGNGGSAAIIAGGRCSDSGTGFFPCVFCNGNLTCVNCTSWCALNCNSLFAGGGGGFGSGGGGGAGAMAISNCYNCCPGAGTTFCLLCMNGNPGEGGSPGAASFGGAGLGGAAAGAAANNAYAQSITPAVYLDGGKKYSFAMSMLSTSGGGGYTEAIQGLGCRGPSQAGFGGGGSGFAPPGFGGGAGMTACGTGVIACGVRAGCGGGGMSQAFSCSSTCATCCSDPGNGFGIVEYWT